MNNVIAIDGPGGAGKSTIAKKLAEKLAYIHLDTGAMYRAVTLAALNRGLAFEEKKLTNLAKDLVIDFNKAGKVFLDNQNVTEKIRSYEVNKYVSKVAAVKGVRDILVKKQQELAKKNKVVMDGRDITTVVLPNAEHKFFLTASLEERAKRRYQELKNKNKKPNLKEIKKNIKLRDKLDSEREHSPLKKAEDAYFLDTTDMNIEEVLQKMLSLIAGGSN